MIIVGFPAIGKSSVCAEQTKIDRSCIDLESSNFTKRLGWETDYVKTAIDLHTQGFNVFISSHKEVREVLHQLAEPGSVLLVFPCLEFKETWLGRLRQRYERNPSTKNYKALQYMLNNYELAVQDMWEDRFPHKLVLTANHNIDNLRASINRYVGGCIPGPEYLPIPGLQDIVVPERIN